MPLNKLGAHFAYNYYYYLFCIILIVVVFVVVIVVVVVQSTGDVFRVVKYDLSHALVGTRRTVPLLVERHSVGPGMFLVREGGREGGREGSGMSREVLSVLQHPPELSL